MKRPIPTIAFVVCCCAFAQDHAARAQQPHPPAPGGVPAQRPVARACPGGTATDVFHAYSECNPRDRRWHVVTDQEYTCRNADGKTFDFRVRLVRGGQF